MRFLFLFFLLLVARGAFATPSATELKKIQNQMHQQQLTQSEMQEKAKEVAAEVAFVKKQMVKAAVQVQNNEEALSELEHNLSELEASKKKLEERLFAREGQMILLMSGLQKMAIHPPESVFFAPQNPVESLRSSLILKSTKQPLQATADKLKVELNKLASLQSAIKAQASQIKLSAARLEVEKEKMEKLVGQKFILQAHFESEGVEAKKRADALGKKAKDLEDLLKKLEKERQNTSKKMAQAAARQKPILSVPSLAAVEGAFEKSLGNLPLPARGRIIQKYGDKTLGGGSAKGLTMQTRAGAQVITPFDGHILFAGPFKDYGNLIIIEHDSGYHSLLSGLARIDCAVGQSVLTGEPVGLMNSEKPDKLYIEFRKEGQAVDPTTWFASKI